ncbi:MAG: tRNA (guanosine(37)-N1)-methyltransferase TrmD [Actinobacteria bacterium]|nr:tRNA (guanosine(37)-N1)-methyltransferase TrmD [Actinomycetota bacterium]
MLICIVTILPEFFASPLGVSIVARALESESLRIELIDLREHGKGTHRQVDDAPFGGGPGMVMMIEPIDRALGDRSGHRVLLTPAGARLRQGDLERWAGMDELVLICGRYEGVDDRVAENLVDEEVSLGDFVLAGGEAAAAAIIEGVARLLPGVVGNAESIESESFRDGLLEEPQYTRPSSYKGWEVPEVLLSGDHGRIERWRVEQRRRRTVERRPDLLGGDSAIDRP